MWAEAINSPVSQKEPVASAVSMYTKQATMHITHPVIVLILLKLIHVVGWFSKSGKNREVPKLKGKGSAQKLKEDYFSGWVVMVVLVYWLIG